MSKDEYKLSLRTLVLEATRRCNENCKICMRGKKQFLDMPEGYVRELFNYVGAIDTLVFSGGEPSIAEDVLECTLACAKEYGVQIRHVYIVTNAKMISRHFLSVCRDWHEYCLRCEHGEDGKVSFERAARMLKYAREDDWEAPGLVVAVSLDSYHEDIPMDSMLKLMSLPTVTLDKYHSEDEGDKWIIAGGNAKENGITDNINRPWEYDKEKAMVLEVDCDGTDGQPVIEEMYVNAEGCILKHCDYSYEMQKEFAICHLSEDGWARKLVEDALEAQMDQ